MKNIILCTYFLCGSMWISAVYAQKYDSFVNARSCAVGSILSVFPGMANPSSLSFESHRRVEMNYANRFNLKELSTFSAAFYYPNPWLNGALYFSRYGFEAYNETRFSVNFSRLLTEKWGLGVRINYDRLHYSEKYPDKGILTADVGMWIEPVKQKVRIGFVLCNPLQTKVELGEGKPGESLPVWFVLGASYYFSTSRLLLAGEIEKEENTSLRYKIGMEYQPFSVLYLRGGMQCTPFSPSFGLGLRVGSFAINAGFSHYSDLGIESFYGICFSF